MALPSVLVIDDDEDVCALVRMSLGFSGKWRVEAAHSQREALEILKKSTPDVVLLDLHLRETLGTNVLPEIRKLAHCAALPVVFLTADSSPSQNENLLALGALAVLPKPIKPLTFARSLHAALAQS